MNRQFEAYLRVCDERQLVAMMESIQARLGTAAEQGNDFVRVAAVAHQLNNLRASAMLNRGIKHWEASGEPPLLRPNQG
jgi:hypothetical protein